MTEFKIIKEQKFPIIKEVKVKIVIDNKNNLEKISYELNQLKYFCGFFEGIKKLVRDLKDE